MIVAEYKFKCKSILINESKEGTVYTYVLEGTDTKKYPSDSLKITQLDVPPFDVDVGENFTIRLIR